MYFLDFSAVTVEQFDLERNAKKISGFEHIAPKYETDEKLISSYYYYPLNTLDLSRIRPYAMGGLH
jgi:hypothetical protein